MAVYSGLIGISYIYFGGDPTVLWVIEIDTGSCSKPTGKIVNIEANGYNIYLPLTDIYSYLLTVI
jgi:hypothetical protein